MLVSVARLLGVHPGLDPRNVLVMAMSLPQENLFYGPPGNPRFCETLGQQVGSVPGVAVASAIGHLPLTRRARGPRASPSKASPIPVRTTRPAPPTAWRAPMSLKALGIPLVEGRDFSVRDTLEAPQVAIVNESVREADLARPDGARQALQDRALWQRRSRGSRWWASTGISITAVSISSRACRSIARISRPRGR